MDQTRVGCRRRYKFKRKATSQPDPLQTNRLMVRSCVKEKNPAGGFSYRLKRLPCTESWHGLRGRGYGEACVCVVGNESMYRARFNTPLRGNAPGGVVRENGGQERRARMAAKNGGQEWRPRIAAENPERNP